MGKCVKLRINYLYTELSTLSTGFHRGILEHRIVDFRTHVLFILLRNGEEEKVLKLFFAGWGCCFIVGGSKYIDNKT